MLNIIGVPQSKWNLNLTIINQQNTISAGDNICAFGIGAIIGGVVGAMATYYACRPSEEERKLLDVFNNTKVATH